MGEIIGDEEVLGDGNWHVAAFSTLMLTSTTIRRAEQQMAGLAGHRRAHSR